MGKTGTILIIALILGAILLAGYAINDAWRKTYTVEGTVTEKWVDYENEGGHYLIHLDDGTENGRMIEISRNIFYRGPEYNPDRIYKELEENTTYSFTCWGWQIDWWFIYMYPNVIDYEETTDK